MESVVTGEKRVFEFQKENESNSVNYHYLSMIFCEQMIRACTYLRQQREILINAYGCAGSISSKPMCPILASRLSLAPHFDQTAASLATWSPIPVCRGAIEVPLLHPVALLLVARASSES